MNSDNSTEKERKRPMNPAFKAVIWCWMLCSRYSFSAASSSYAPRCKSRKVYLCPKLVDFGKIYHGLAALIEPDVKVAVFSLVLFVFLNRPRNQVKICTGSATGPALAQAPRVRAIQNIARCQRGSKWTGYCFIALKEYCVAVASISRARPWRAG